MVSLEFGYKNRSIWLNFHFLSRIGLLESLIGLFELPEDVSTADDEHFIDVEDTPGKDF